MLPLMAALLFLFFFRSLRWYGAALVLATHFMVYNLCFFIFHCIVDWLPGELWGHQYGQILSRPLNPLFTGPTATAANFLFGSSFELLNLVFWVPWLAIAFRRLFNKAWWINILTAFIAGKVFYYLIFGFFKKLLIAFTLWTMH